MMKFMLLVLAGGVALAAGTISYSYSQEDSGAAPESLLPEQIELDGRTLTKKQILDAFLDIAFTQNILLKKGLGQNSLSFQIQPDEHIKRSLFFEPRMKSEYPWLYPHIYLKHAPPKILSINKWVIPIQVSLGMPNDLRPITGQAYHFFKIYNADKTFSPSEDSIVKLKGLIQTINEISDISAALALEETANHFGNIRIVFVEKEHFKDSEYKHPKYMMVSFSTGGPRTEDFRSFYGAEKKIKTGFVYTAEAEKQVDGYFLTNSKNEIQMAFCYIWSGHPVEMLDALMQECVLRSLGFPEATITTPYSLLGLWNEPEHWLPADKPLLEIPSKLSEFDRYMLKILYSPELKPGMDYVEAQKVLLGMD
ncbi:MAG: hypothetical protein NPIRA01_09900 [Nitrospirales bacterium]|nr:MAG: hypothetical protein NPIRA01_09900 [Nitrospirales bacterium]